MLPTAALNAFAKLLTTFSDAAFKQAVAEKDVAPVAFLPERITFTS